MPDALPATAPTTAPAAAPATAADQPDNEQQQDGADGGVDDRADDSDAEMQAELRHQPIADEGANDADDQVTNDPKSGSLHDFTGQPPGDKPDQQDDQKTFGGQVHGDSLGADHFAAHTRCGGGTVASSIRM